MKNKRRKRNNGANSVKTFETVASTFREAPMLAAEVDVLWREKELIKMTKWLTHDQRNAS